MVVVLRGEDAEQHNLKQTCITCHMPCTPHCQCHDTCHTLCTPLVYTHLVIPCTLHTTPQHHARTTHHVLMPCTPHCQCHMPCTSQCHDRRHTLCTPLVYTHLVIPCTLHTTPQHHVRTTHHVLLAEITRRCVRVKHLIAKYSFLRWFRGCAVLKLQVFEFG